MSAVAAPVLADVLPRTRLRDAALVLGGTAFVAVVGQAEVPLPFTPVPLTLGTFGVLLVGAALGPVRAGLSLTLLVLLGVAGVPVFAGGGSGWALASFGYAVGYVPAGVLLGWLARRGADRSVWRTALGAVASTAVVYLVGVPWLMGFLGVGLGQALALGVVPFLVGDVVKAVAAAALLPGTWRLLGRAGRAPGGAGAYRAGAGGARADHAPAPGREADRWR
ncbi:biotin transporter BioY [Georgenia sp. TF02-10]|uniref:biotin transporter BioY n=1 Tax=Georgenia sp. TF02-10 TaxID=2917725 RepID=UPI001FA712FE|nr:biotin transporter BioY [Georgenia sp. TF02-10]UNX53186.1 biotin transporter BioY [Georgenia sp. TF02-10]